MTLRLKWLNLNHPVAAREIRRIQIPIPTPIKKLSDAWKMIGYAAILQGLIFVAVLVSYSRLLSISGAIAVFVTPFGMIFTLAFLQTILYWIVQIGICNYTSRAVATEINRSMWSVLRMTPFSISEILLAKVAVVFRTWAKPIRTLVLIRAILLAVAFAAMLIPAANHPVDIDPTSNISMNFTLAAIFVLEPLIDMAVAASLSILSAMLVHNSTWAMITSYALNVILFGGLSFVSGLWLLLVSPLGTLSGLLIPLNHWLPLFAAVTPPTSAEESTIRVALFVVTFVIAPLGIGWAAFRLSTWMGSRIY